MTEIISKDCTKCSTHKPVGDFFKKYGSPRSECKSCSKKTNASYASRNTEKVREINKSYREKNADKLRDEGSKYREANKELCKSRTQDWVSRNHDKRLEYSRQYYQENREEIIQKNKEYYEQNPEQRTIQEQRRRSRKKELASDFSTPDWEIALTYFNNKCCYCGIESQKLQQEHIIPLSKGGDYSSYNIAPACRTCNLNKYTHDMETWYRSKEYFSEVALTQIKAYVKMHEKAGAC